jgi:hypothetical protein
MLGSCPLLSRLSMIWCKLLTDRTLVIVNASGHSIIELIMDHCDLLTVCAVALPLSSSSCSLLLFKCALRCLMT